MAQYIELPVDSIELDKATYEKAIRLCAKYGISELSNYVLYNSEDFGGKGKKYHADTPEDLYDRMRITLDIKDDINEKLPQEQAVEAFSFPMRYIPLNAHERGYVGSKWNAKFLRSVQCMLIPTQGKGVGKRSFFEADFGKNSQEFVRFLCMPDSLIAARGNFVEGGRGRTKETTDELNIRRANWSKNQKKLAEWNRLFDQLENERDSFIDLISDNEFLPEKVLGATSEIQKKLYLFYLTLPRLITLLGIIDHDSPTYSLLYSYITTGFVDFYNDIIEFVAENETQHPFVFKNFSDFFGKNGIIDLLKHLEKDDYSSDQVLKRWTDVCRKNNIEYIDFELIRIYHRYVELDALDPESHSAAQECIRNMDMPGLALILDNNFHLFENRVILVINSEVGKKILKETSQSICRNIQMKLSLFL